MLARVCTQISAGMRTGTGPNTYGAATLFYQTTLPGLHLREAQNEYLQPAAEGGLLIRYPLSRCRLCSG